MRSETAMSNDTRCANCESKVGYDGGSIPVDNNGDVVPPSHAGEWGGVPACSTCVALYNAAGENARQVLDVYANATTEDRANLKHCYGTLAKILELAEEAQG